MTVETPATAEELWVLWQDPSRVNRVYLGASNKCYCGCSGTYATARDLMRSRLLKMAQLVANREATRAYKFTGFNETLMTVEYGNDRALTAYVKLEAA